MKNFFLLAVSVLILSPFCPSINCNQNETDLICVDNVTTCHKDNTCCPGKEDTYVCCPYKNGVCCIDGEHCCPERKRCDLRNMRCVGVVLLLQSDNEIPSTDTKYVPKHTTLSKKVNNVCPNPQYSCSGLESCCVTPTKQYKCCPYSYGTCCADGSHCCPYGMKCINNTYCERNLNESISTVDTSPVNRYGDITCKDGHHCEDDNTCCQLSSGDWGCCPLKNAICCADKIHCCPHGTICDVAQGICLSSNTTST